MKRKRGLISETIISICIPGAIISLFVLLFKLEAITSVQIGYLLPLAITLAAIFYLEFKKIPLSDIGIKRKGLRRSVLYSTILIIIFLIYGILNYRQRVNLENTTLRIFLGGLYGIFIIALGEEIWARGIIFNLLEKLKGGYFALLASSLVFGLFHIRHGVDAILFGLIFGLSFGFVRLETKNILGLVLSHGIFILINTYLLT